MDELDLDTMLAIIGNPTRRLILRKLAREMHYPLQLSKELKISQQSIMKHLSILEEHELVASSMQKSDSGGPPRKYFTATKRFSIIIDITPSVFNEEIRLMEPIVDSETRVLADISLDDEKKTAEKAKLMDLALLINELNSRIKLVEEERYRLMAEKEGAVKLAYRLVDLLCDDYEERRVLRFILEQDDVSVAQMSKMLDMKVIDIENVLRKLEEDGLLIVNR